MKYIVSIDKLKDAGKDIKDYANNNMKSNILALYKMNRDMKWKSPAKISYTENFDTLINRLYKMENAIETYGEFLSFCSEHYGECADELQKGWEEHLKELEDKLDLTREIDFM